MDKSVQTDLTWLQDSPVVLETSTVEQDEHTVLASRRTPSETDASSVKSEAITGDETNRERSDTKQSVDTVEDAPNAIEPLQSLTDILGDASDDSTTDDGEGVSPSASSPPPPYASLPKANLPWPAILQYLRESESESSRYFGLSPTSPQPTSVAQPPTSSIHSQLLCHFCGKVPFAFSLITLTHGEQVNLLL